MTIPNESEVTVQLSDMILKAGANLFKATKYLYALTSESYYHCDIKDFFKVILNNIFNADVLSAFQISIDGDACVPLNTREYFSIFPLIIYSFAARLPVLCNVRSGSGGLTVRQTDAIYSAVLERGISNTGGAVAESYESVMASVRRGKGVPPYSAEWFRTYIYTSVPELADISNRNLYFTGAADVLFPLYYLCLEKEFETRLNTLIASNKPVAP
ncbi:hypothetical protein SAMN02745823_02372 [Sporobacter termitidis DSM 10068]|uniref:Uncharacterized protein n=1 Tax=Sporobacter termitidis DSM 10068 TaxID=1123282 RepID=A0A1M5YCK6_9FIRM|nr:hypothetical protein [Sporobacter termitidis]SHI09696.1 hypothetical protein SAMN02745823_02372 [Sporobacter termitidis DSM 10068]